MRTILAVFCVFIVSAVVRLPHLTSATTKEQLRDFVYQGHTSAVSEMLDTAQQDCPEARISAEDMRDLTAIFATSDRHMIDFINAAKL